MPVRLGRCIIIIFPSNSISDFPVKFPASMNGGSLRRWGMRRYFCDTLAILPMGTGLVSLRAAPLRRRRIANGKLQYRVIKIK
jgi:hypothetical protein